LLDDQYLQDEGKAVGIIGIRSVFSGPMDDLPGKVPKDAADSLPFYILIAGPVADVRLASKRLVDFLPIAKADCFQMIFAHRMVDSLNRPIKIDDRVERPGFTLKPSDIRGSQEMGIPVLSNVKHDVAVQLVDFPDAEIGSLGPHVRVDQPECFKVQAMTFVNGKPQADSAASEALSFDMRSKQVKIDRSKLSKTTYLFQLDLSGKQAMLEKMSDWGLESDERDRVVSQQSFDKDESGNRPGKTPNLRHFLNVLALKMFQSNIRLRRYYFYVEAN
jgi:hypothetical protein